MTLACGIAACAQFDPPIAQPVQQQSANGRATGKTGISHASASARLFGRAVPNTSTTDSPFRTRNSLSFRAGYGNFWDHLRAKFQLPESSNRYEVQAQIKWYMRHGDYLNRIITRSAPYLYFILEQTQQRNLPAEFVLLPIMESAYNPFANSNKGAVGLWQLMHHTANGWGVKQDWWYDGRRDIYASTNAALDYLTYLQSYFGGDWLLAIGAYNAGEGTLQVAVRRNAKEGRNTDFWELQLPSQTKTYVPRLLALASILRNPERYGITLPAIDDRPYLQPVDLGTPVNLVEAAKLAGMSLAELKQLNPGYNHAMTAPDGPYKILLPVDKIAMFKQNLANSPGLSKTKWARYKVQKGDTVASIAKKHKITVAELKQANSFKKNKAPVGKVIMIPMGIEYVKPHLDDESNSADTQVAANQMQNSQNQQENVVPAPTANNARYSNDMDMPLATTNPNYLSTLAANTDTASEQGDSTPASTSQQVTHTIRSGETLFSIAKHYGVTTSDIMSWNKLKSKKALKAGHKIIILTSNSTDGVAKATVKRASSTKVASVKRSQHRVKKGDTLAAIARRYGVKQSDLQKWNKLGASSALKPGQNLIVKG